MSCLPTVVFPLNIVWMAACLTSVGSRHRLKFLQTLCTNFNTQTMLRYQVTHTPLSLQHSLNALADAYQRAGLAINAKKTEILSLGSHPSPASQPSFTVHGDALNTTQHFTYLGSILASDLDLFHEIQQRIKLASSAFGRLGHRVFFNHNLSVATKVAVYKAICISILLYGCESWVPYRRHIKALEAHQIRCLKHSKCTLVAQENPYRDTSSSQNWLCWASVAATSTSLVGSCNTHAIKSAPSPSAVWWTTIWTETSWAAEAALLWSH